MTCALCPELNPLDKFMGHERRILFSHEICSAITSAVCNPGSTVLDAQVIGSWGFIISASMFCLEVQKHWWLPRPFNLGWQVAPCLSGPRASICSSP